MTQNTHRLHLQVVEITGTSYKMTIGSIVIAEPIRDRPWPSQHQPPQIAPSTTKAPITPTHNNKAIVNLDTKP